jgi:hypothetical protein
MGTGRFVSVDPFEGFTGQPLTLPDYLYGLANPVNAIDPAGDYAILGLALRLSFFFIPRLAVADQVAKATSLVQTFATHSLCWSTGDRSKEIRDSYYRINMPTFALLALGAHLPYGAAVWYSLMAFNFLYECLVRS